MNSVQITYIVCVMVMRLVFLALAVAAPILITPGYYWWTALALFMMAGQSLAFTKRLNTWDGMGMV